MAGKVRKTVQGSLDTDSVGNGEPMEVHDLRRKYLRFGPSTRFFPRETTGSNGG